MDKFKETIFRLAKSHPNKPLSPSQISFIEEQLLLTFPLLRTPTHPTYSVMIQNAIKELNEEDGSNEESISEYIKANYDDLPWAHVTYLSHHLRELCNNNEIEIVSTSTCKRYVTAARSVGQGHDLGRRRPKRRLKRKRKESVVENDEERSLGEENVIEFKDEGILVSERSKMKRRRRSCLVMEDEDDKAVEHAVVVAEQNVCNNSQALVVVAEQNVCNNSQELVVVAEQNVFNNSQELVVVAEPNVCSNSQELVVENVSCDAAELDVESGENAGSNPVIVCGLEWEELPKSKQQACKGNPKKRLKDHQEKREASLKLMPSLPAKDVGCNQLEHDQIHELLSQRGVETEASAGMESDLGPPWLIPLLKGNYFIPCSLHAKSSKSKCNLFCLDCMGDAFCANCLSLHNESHRIVQIRRSPSCYNVVKVDEIQMYLDISSVQTHIKNSAVIVRLNGRPRPGPGKYITRTCKNCRLLDPSRFCSLGCQLYAKLLKSSEVKNLPVDQSQQACTSSLLEDSSNENLETQKHLDPLHANSLEELMLMEDEENLPLQMVFEKCGKQKKHAETKFATKVPLAQETQNQYGAQLEAPMTSLVEGKWEQEIKEDVVAVSNQLLLQQEEFPKPATYCNLKQQKQPLKKDGCIRPRKVMKGLSNAATGQKSGRGRPQKQKETIKEDALAVSSSDLQQQEELSKAAIIDQHSQVQIKQPKKRGRPRKHTEATKEDKPASLETCVQLQEGFSESAISQCSLQLPKKDGRGIPQEHIEATKDDTEASLNLHLEIQEGLFKPATDECTKQQTQNLKKKGPGSPQKQVEATTEDAAVCSNLHVHQQEGSSKRETKQLSQEQVKRVKKDGRGRPRKQKTAAKEHATASSELALHQRPLLRVTKCKDKLLKKDGQGTPRKLQEDVEKDPEALMNLYLQEKKQEITKDDSEAPLNLPHKLEKLSKVDDCPDAEPEKSSSEVHVTPESGQVMQVSYDEIHQSLKKQKMDGGGLLPEAIALTTSSANQPDQQQEQQCHEQEEVPLSKPSNLTEMQVPLSCKDQLRSRIKRQSQDSS
ncbi:uncharacterized protein LOC104896830 [Beta vulgaris subsp. vulgaris]|uniref:uncharacterized protein LOC104896830 n=1 Tax=Beta vulgaris subsp. vulgaris TaxID=3555 RepID=UPI00203709F5|nr:uncharacterized protein LOC104896830 [Beta vulgaris subsp. vulgaris]